MDHWYGFFSLLFVLLFRPAILCENLCFAKKGDKESEKRSIRYDSCWQLIYSCRSILIYDKIHTKREKIKIENNTTKKEQQQRAKVSK